MGVPGKILVIKPSSLGDIVHVFPALEILHRAFPDSELDFVVNPAFADILDLSPFPVRKKILFDRKKLSKVSTFFPELFKLIREIRSEQYETVVDFQVKLVLLDKLLLKHLLKKVKLSNQNLRKQVSCQETQE